MKQKSNLAIITNDTIDQKTINGLINNIIKNQDYRLEIIINYKDKNLFKSEHFLSYYFILFYKWIDKLLYKKHRPASHSNTDSKKIYNVSNLNNLYEIIELRNIDFIVFFCSFNNISKICKTSNVKAITYEFGTWIDSDWRFIGLNEILERRPTSIIRIVYFNLLGQRKVLRTARTQSILKSWYLNKKSIIAKLLFMIPRELSKLNDEFFQPQNEIIYSSNKKKLNQFNLDVINGISLIKRFFKLFFYLITRLYNRTFFHTNWTIGFVKVLDHYNYDFINSIIFKPPSSYITWADPFFIEKENKIYLFFEEKIKDTNGHISIMILDKDGNIIDEPKIILKQDHHLSFPNVFEINDEFYMLPESIESNSLNLYKSIKFPYKWRMQRQLLKGSYADPSIIFFDEYYWIFVTKSCVPSASSNDELYIYHTSDLNTGKIYCHPQNPVKTSCRQSRNGGAIHIYDDKIIRVAQETNFEYGEKVKLFHISELSPTSFKEELLKVIDTSWKESILGLHTLNFNDQYAVFDMKRKKLKYVG